MPQGSSAWVWMSIATMLSMSGSLSLDMRASWRLLDFGTCKLIISYNGFGKASAGVVLRPGTGVARPVGPERSVWIDIRPRHGLETAGPGRHGRRRDKAHFATISA